MPLALLFDLDGTLADSLELILGAVHHTFRTHLRLVPPDHAWIAGLGTPLASQLRALVDDPALVQPMIATYHDWQAEHHDALLHEFAGVRDTLASVHANGHPTALVTSKGNAAAHRALAVLGLAPYLDHVVGLDSTRVHKPNPEPVQLALALLRRLPDEALFIGDSPHDIAAGNAAGVRTVGALWGPFAREVLVAAAPTRLLADIRDLPALVQELDAAPPTDPAPPHAHSNLPGRRAI